MTIRTVGSKDPRSDAKFRFSVALTGGAALLLLTALAAAPALSAEKGVESIEGYQVAQADFSREQLESFAVASLDVEEINQEWMPRIEQAESAEKSEDLRDEAIEEMTVAVRDAGLSVEAYNQIYDAVERNPELASIVEDYRREHSE